MRGRCARSPGGAPVRHPARGLRPVGSLLAAVLLLTCATDAPLAPRPPGPGAGPGQELLGNPGLEAGRDWWSSSDAPGRHISLERAHSGRRALQIEASRTVGRTVYQELSASAGKTYTATAWVATSGLEGEGATVALLWLDTLGLTGPLGSGHVIRSDPLGALSGTADWTRLFQAFTAPARTRAVRLALLLGPESDGAGDGWFDDISLVWDAPPTITLTSPLPGSLLTGQTVLMVDARDDIGVVLVEIEVDGRPIGIDSTAPYRLEYRTSTLPNGPHTISATARDRAGHATVTPPVLVTFLNGHSGQGSIVVILTDDQRYDMMSAMPLTSALLTAETVRFDQAFVTTSLCCPSRTSILTGQYEHRHQITGNYMPFGGALKFPATSTFATWLHSVGYRTGLVGKYLNSYQNMAPRMPPGWDDFQGLMSPQSYFNDTINQNGVIHQFGGSPQDYVTDVLTGLATDFISTTPAEQPLLLYFNPIAPHVPAVPHPGDVGSHAGFPNWRPPSFNEADVSDKPTWVQALPVITQTQINRSDVLHRKQLETLQAVDRGVAAIVAALKASGRWGNTLLIFMSDNGMTWGEHRLRDTKYCAYEECVRVPLWIRAPGVMARNDSSIVANIDLAPTIAAWAGVSPPDVVNGRSLLPLMVNPAIPWRTSLLIEHLHAGTPPTPDSHGVRTSQYLYNEFLNGELELYDLRADPYQLSNIAGDPANARLIDTLKAELGRLAQE